MCCAPNVHQEVVFRGLRVVASCLLLNNLRQRDVKGKRRGRDSNPWRGFKPPHRFSKPALSAAQPPLQRHSPHSTYGLFPSSPSGRSNPWQGRSGLTTNTKTLCKQPCPTLILSGPPSRARPTPSFHVAHPAGYRCKKIR